MNEPNLVLYSSCKDAWQGFISIIGSEITSKDIVVGDPRYATAKNESNENYYSQELGNAAYTWHPHKLVIVK